MDKYQEKKEKQFYMCDARVWWGMIHVMDIVLAEFANMKTII